MRCVEQHLSYLFCCAAAAAHLFMSVVLAAVLLSGPALTFTHIHGIKSQASRPSLASIKRHGCAQCGFEVETVDDKALKELGVMNWPNLEKRQVDFSKSAANDELLMVYVKDGSATLSEGDQTATVAAGQIVMVSAGEVRWSKVGDGVTLLSVLTALEGDGDVVDDGLEDERNVLKANIAKSLTGSTRGLSMPTKEEEPLSLTEAVKLLAAGLVAGWLFSFGLKTFQTPDF